MVNGILVQLPLPKHIDEEAVIKAIAPEKDVDGFHPETVGNMCIGSKGFLPCTPAGVIQLLKRSNIEIEGKECVVIGRDGDDGVEITAVIVPDYEVLGEGTTDTAVSFILKEAIAQINRSLPPYKHINHFEIRKNEFERTLSKKMMTLVCS